MSGVTEAGVYFALQGCVDGEAAAGFVNVRGCQVMRVRLRRGRGGRRGVDSVSWEERFVHLHNGGEEESRVGAVAVTAEEVAVTGEDEARCSEGWWMH